MGLTTCVAGCRSKHTPGDAGGSGGPPGEFNQLSLISQLRKLRSSAGNPGDVDDLPLMTRIPTDMPCRLASISRTRARTQNTELELVDVNRHVYQVMQMSDVPAVAVCDGFGFAELANVPNTSNAVTYTHVRAACQWY